MMEADEKVQIENKQDILVSW